MKKNLLLIAVLLFAIGCEAQKKSKEYTLTGTCALSGDNDKVYLCRIVSSSLDIADSSVVQNGNFVFKGAIDGADLRVLVAFKGSSPVSQALIVLENGNIQVTMPIGNTQPVVSGSPNYDLYLKFSETMDVYTQKAQMAWAKFSSQEMPIYFVKCSKKAK